MIEYIRTEKLQIGDIIAKNLYDESGRVLLVAGKALTDTAIKVIQRYAYKGIYIDNIDEFRRESIPIPESLIDELIQIHLLKVLKSIYNNKALQVDHLDAQFMKDKKELHVLLEKIIDKMQLAEEQGKLLFELEDSRNVTTWLYFHSMKVCFLSIGIAIKLGLNRDEIMEIALGAIYHDLGKAWFSDSVVHRKNLNDIERDMLREHPDKMFRFLQKHNYSVSTLYAVWQHHEKINGTGYPSGVKAGQFARSARIVACANVYDNLVNMNPYAEDSMYQADAIEYISANEEQDIECVKALLQIVAPYPVGTRVRLSNGEEGVVVKNVLQFPLRPILISGREMMVLHQNPNYRNITITEVVE